MNVSRSHEYIPVTITCKFLNWDLKLMGKMYHYFRKRGHILGKKGKALGWAVDLLHRLKPTLIFLLWLCAQATLTPNVQFSLDTRHCNLFRL